MKKHISSLSVILFLLGAIAFQSCTKTATVTFNGAILAQHHQDSVSAIYNSGLANHNWEINSITVYPAQNGSSILPIDPCDKKVTYTFYPLNLGQGVEGFVDIHYNNSPCNTIKRPSSADTQSTYYLNNNPKTLIFSDVSSDGKMYKYTILKSTNDSLVLQINQSGYVYTKTYLPFN